MQRVFFGALWALGKKIAPMASQTFVGMLAVACVTIRELWHTDAMQAIPSHFAVQVAASWVTIPTCLIRSEAPANVINTLLHPVKTDAVYVALIAFLACPDHNSTKAQVTGSKLFAMTLVVEMTRRTQSLFFESLRNAPTFARWSRRASDTTTF